VEQIPYVDARGKAIWSYRKEAGLGRGKEGLGLLEERVRKCSEINRLPGLILSTKKRKKNKTRSLKR